MNINALIQLTENDKRILIVLLLVLILIFVIVGYIGVLITRVMKWQGKRMDNMMHDIVITRVVTDPKSFKRVARKKNWRYFYKTAWIPLLIIVLAVALYLIALSTNNWNYDLFDYQKSGFNTLFFVYDFSDPNIYTNIFGLTVLASWPPLVNTPHFETEAIFSYFIVPIFICGVIWYLIDLQCLISRTIRIHQLADSIYSKNLSDFNINNINAINLGMMNSQNNKQDIQK